MHHDALRRRPREPPTIRGTWPSRSGSSATDGIFRSFLFNAQRSLPQSPRCWSAVVCTPSPDRLARPHADLRHALHGACSNLKLTIPNPNRSRSWRSRIVDQYTPRNQRFDRRSDLLARLAALQPSCQRSRGAGHFPKRDLAASAHPRSGPTHQCSRTVGVPTAFVAIVHAPISGRVRLGARY